MTNRDSFKYVQFMCINIYTRNCSSASKCKMCSMCTKPLQRLAGRHLYTYVHIFAFLLRYYFISLTATQSVATLYSAAIRQKIVHLRIKEYHNKNFFLTFFYILPFSLYTIFTFLYFSFFLYFSYLHISLPAVIFKSELFSW